MFTTISFTNLDGDGYDFIPNDYQRVRAFSPSVAMRGEDRKRMQMHGRHAVSVYADALQIHHDGLIVAPGRLALLDERDQMLDTILGDLTAAPTSTALGTLTVRKENWAETASAPCSLESWSSELTFQSVNRLPYLFAWIVYAAVFTGDVTANPYKL